MLNVTVNQKQMSRNYELERKSEQNNRNSINRQKIRIQRVEQHGIGRKSESNKL